MTEAKRALRAVEISRAAELAGDAGTGRIYGIVRDAGSARSAGLVRVAETARSTEIARGVVDAPNSWPILRAEREMGLYEGFKTAMLGESCQAMSRDIPLPDR